MNHEQKLEQLKNAEAALDNAWRMLEERPETVEQVQRIAKQQYDCVQDDLQAASAICNLIMAQLTVRQARRLLDTGNE